MNRFLSFFEHAGKDVGKLVTNPEVAAGLSIAGPLVSLVNPALGGLLQTVANGVVAVEAQAAAMKANGIATSGAAKKTQVQAIVDIAAPLTLQAVSAATGKTVSDPAAVAPIVDDFIDLIVKFFNDFHLFTHAAKLVPAAPTAKPAA
jgi:hypothetical protein